MTINEAGKLVCHIQGKPEAKLTFAEAFGTLITKLAPFGIDVACVPYPTNESKIMIVTQKAPWSGWKVGNNPKDLPQFKQGKREDIAKLALEKHGESLFYILYLVPYLLFPQGCKIFSLLPLIENYDLHLHSE